MIPRFNKRRPGPRLTNGLKPSLASVAGRHARIRRRAARLVLDAERELWARPTSFAAKERVPTRTLRCAYRQGSREVERLRGGHRRTVRTSYLVKSRMTQE